MRSEWYVAKLMKLIMKCEVGDNDKGSWTCEEQVRVILAAEGDEAYDKAIRLGAAEEIAYQNVYGEEVRCSFVGLGQLEGLTDETIEDGTEITSRFIETDDPSALVLPRERLNALWWKSNPHGTQFISVSL